MSSFENDGSKGDSHQDPSLQLGAETGRGRYPNPFFDLSQQYMPPTIKELFRWCTFYYYNSPLIGAAITKISRYPITDLVYEAEKESTRQIWENLFSKTLRIKETLMEINLDFFVYGNAFVSLHLPFTRFLKCKGCGLSQPINQWKWHFNSNGSYEFQGQCKDCGTHGPLEVRDVPFKDKSRIRIIRWNPENIQVKFNEYTGRRVYMYTVPYKLKSMIERGDRDILEDIPLIVIEALKKRRMIRLNDDNFKHLRRPTLAEQDQGWGKPLILHVLKDMYYFYTLRRAQESIAHEHIVPFDIIYPMPNAQQDPYIHTDLGNWRQQIENIIKQHRRDPNFKGVIPVPVGFGRLGGDGKAMMLTPELNYLTQTIVGGMGIPQEFLFGGLNFTGSSISLRTLENDFIQNRAQLEDIVLWVKDKIRIWLNLPDIKNIHFAEFRMADDVQRNQQLIGLNSQQKISDQTMLNELGYDWEQEQKKMIEEAHFQNYLNDIRAKAAAKTQGETGIIQYNYQQKIQELAKKHEEEARKKFEDKRKKMLMEDARGSGETGEVEEQEMPPPQMASGWQNHMQSDLASGQGTQGSAYLPGGQPAAGQGENPQATAAGQTPAQAQGRGAPQQAQQMAAGAPAQQAQGPPPQEGPPPEQAPPQRGGQEAPGQPPAQSSAEMEMDQNLELRARRFAQNLTDHPVQDAVYAIERLKQKTPEFGQMVEHAYRGLMSEGTPGNMEKAPESSRAEGMS